MMAVQVWQLFFSLNFIFGLGNAQFNIDCVECIDFIQAVSKFLIQDEVITSIEGHLKRDVCAGLYMIGYGKGKIILKFPPFFRLNEENQERGNSKHQMKIKIKIKTFLFLFSFDF